MEKAAEAAEKPKAPKGATPIIGEPLNIFLREDRAVVEEIVTGRSVGSISFDQDELYYVVLPLLEDPQVEARAAIKKTEKNRKGSSRIQVAIELGIPKMLRDTPVCNSSLIKELFNFG